MYSKTHRFFRFEHTPRDFPSIWGTQEIDMCRKHIGDNDPNQVLQLRKWFSSPEGVWVRHDCLDNSLITWFALKGKDEFKTT